MRDKDGEEEPIGQDESKAIWNNLLEAGYINKSGEIQDSFDPKNPHFELKIDNRYDDIKPAIIDEMQRYLFKSRVVNARCRERLELRKKVYLSSEFEELWNKIKHRTRYRVEFSTNKLIDRAVERIKKLDKIKPARITITKVEINISRCWCWHRSANGKHLEER